MQRILTYLLLITLSISALADNASNVKAIKSRKTMVITYDLSKTSNVRLLMSIGKNGEFKPLTSVEGAVGKNVHPGKDLTIVWSPLKEYSKFVEKDVRFKVEALGSYDQYASPKLHTIKTFVLGQFGYAFAPQLSYGAMFGQTYHGYGWFVSGRSNFQTCSSDLFAQEEGRIDGKIPFYSGKMRKTHFTVNAGAVIDILEAAKVSKNRFNSFGLYVGAGYGARNLYWELTDGRWVTYLPSSYSDLSVNAGIIGSIYGITLSAGVNTIAFNYLEMEVGVGFMF